MCDTAVRVLNDRVLFAKNSDRDPNEGQAPEWHPRKTHAKGSRIKCSYVEIPQVEQTHAVLISRPFWMWGAEIGANEHGVVIGNEAVFTSQPYSKTGLTGMDLLRLGLERGSTAEEAIAVITGLLREYGQGGGCGYEDRDFTYHNSFIAADARGAIVLETAGKEFATEKVQGARSISNGLTIPAFAAQYIDEKPSEIWACRLRQPRTQALAGGASGVAEMMAMLRDHGDGRTEPHYTEDTGAMGAPCMHGGGRKAGAQTTASWVAELRPGAASHWITATAAPCLSLFKPVRVEQPVDIGPFPTDRPDGSLFWRHEKLHRMVMKNPAALRPLFIPELDAVQARWLAHPPAPEAAFAEASVLLEKWTKAVQVRVTEDMRPEPVRAYWAQRSAQMGA